MPVRADLRNVAIIAHVDHGKTTLVDAMLWQSGAFRANQDVEKRVMDSMDLEREKGITILAKNTAVDHLMADGTTATINIIDTPGHADFGGEVERGLEMVDGVLLLVDASEGPLPQTRFVLRKALAKHLPIVVVINKVDRHDARISEVTDEVYELFLDLLEDDEAHKLDFPVIYCAAKAGRASLNQPEDGGMPDSENLEPLFSVIMDAIPAPEYTDGAPLQAHVTNLDASPYLGRLALCRVINGTLRRGQNVAWCKADGSITNVRLSELLMTHALERLPADEAGPGDIVAIAGIPDIMIGETLSDPENPAPLPLIHVDEPSISMTIGINTAPLAGKAGNKLTARLLKARLDSELIGNVSIRVEDTDSPDVISVAGRGELQLAVLIESMRREGYELQVSRPEVIVRDIDGKRHEPLERVVVDVPDEHVGTLTQAIAPRKGQVLDVRPGDPGRTIVTFEAPARGLLGFRSLLLTQTRGTALMHQHHGGWVPWAGELPHRSGGAMISDRAGAATGYALDNLQARGEFFIEPGADVYEGMVVGENARPDDMVINVVREKQKTNIRTHSHDEAIKLAPPRPLTLETAIEFIADDELVEVTPTSLRVRKRILREQDRRRLTKK